VRGTANGGRVATLSLARSRTWKDQAGERQERTEWHRVALWNTRFVNLADIAERCGKKGDKLYIDGSIEYRSWQDREGQTRYTTEINARELILLSARGCGVESSSRSGAEPSASGAAAKGKELFDDFDDFPEALDGSDDLPYWVRCLLGMSFSERHPEAHAGQPTRERGLANGTGVEV
jgi:single-strand DNA-binding protein